MVIGAVISRGGSTRKIGAICPGLLVGAAIFKGGCPGLKIGISILCSTVSIQNVAVIWTASALGVVTGGLPSKKAILSVPPPNSGGGGEVETVKTIVFVMV